MSSVICPVDNDSCEGACGTKDSPTCLSRCERVRSIVNVIKSKSAPVGIILPPNSQATHGKFTMAMKHRCQCEECLDYYQKTLIKKRIVGKAYRDGQRNPQTMTHGSSYAWGKIKCTCDICQAAKDKWHEERYAKKRADYHVRKITTS